MKNGANLTRLELSDQLHTLKLIIITRVYRCIISGGLYKITGVILSFTVIKVVNSCAIHGVITQFWLIDTSKNDCTFAPHKKPPVNTLSINTKEGHLLRIIVLRNIYVLSTYIAVRIMDSFNIFCLISFMTACLSQSDWSNNVSFDINHNV